MADGVAAARGGLERVRGGLTNGPVRPEMRPFSETVFGHRVDDPYRWMESPDHAAEVADFLARAGDHTTAQLRSLPGWQRLRERVAAGMRSGVQYFDVWEVGDRLFYCRQDPDAQHEKLVVREPDGEERVLYDPESPGNGLAAVHAYSVSPGAATVAFVTAEQGSEIGSVRFVDVATGTLLPARLGPVFGTFAPAWLDERTVVYTLITNRDAADPFKHMQSVLHRLGSDGEAPRLLGTEAAGGPALAPEENPIVVVSAGSDWVLGLAFTARADSRVLVARREDVTTGAPAWREVATYDDQVSRAALRGDTLFVCTTRDSSHGAVLAVDLAGGGGLGSASRVLERPDLIVAELAAADDGLYVIGRTDGVSRLFHVPDGGEAAEVELPFPGTAGSMRRAGAAGGVTFLLFDWFTATRRFRARAGEVSSLGLDSAGYEGLRGARQERLLVTSADGTQVPLVILRGGDAGPGPAPTLLWCYGCYGLSTTEPYYAPYRFGFLESGGVIALCGTRGGGERGRAWHDAGRAANKPNAHADLIAAAEELVRLGVTRPDMLTVVGASAGGLLAPPVALKRPDLFAGLVAIVAAMNPTRLAVARNGADQYAEMGDPNTPDGFEALWRQDAYAMLEEAADMPDTLLTVGLNDSRIDPWMTAKYAARALEKFGDRRLVLVRADREGGHGIFGHAVDQLVDEWTDVYAFVLNRAGVEGFTRTAPPSRARG